MASTPSIDEGDAITMEPVQLTAILAALGILFAAKLIPKIGFVLPLARRYIPRHATFATLLMSTGLTFGTIASLYALSAGIIDESQFSLLITVVVGSALIRPRSRRPSSVRSAAMHLGVRSRRMRVRPLPSPSERSDQAPSRPRRRR